MQTTWRSLNGFTRAALVLFTASLGVMALGMGAHRLIVGQPWIEAAMVVTLSLVWTMGAWEICRRFLLKPSVAKVDHAASMLERSVLMQEAMRSALSILADGLMQQDATLEEIAEEFVERQRSDESEDLPGSHARSPRERRFAATLKNLRREAESRAQIASTLLAANETVGLRHSELHELLRELRGMLHRPILGNAKTSSGSKGVVAGHGEENFHYVSPTGPDPLDSAPGSGFSWPSEPTSPSLPDFRIPKNQGRGRFGRN